MKRILATGDKSEVSMVMRAEWDHPVSAVAPAMLVSEMETQRQPKAPLAAILPSRAIHKRPQPGGAMIHSPDLCARFRRPPRFLLSHRTPSPLSKPAPTPKEIRLAACSPNSTAA